MQIVTCDKKVIVKEEHLLAARNLKEYAKIVFYSCNCKE